MVFADEQESRQFQDSYRLCVKLEKIAHPYRNVTARINNVKRIFSHHGQIGHVSLHKFDRELEFSSAILGDLQLVQGNVHRGDERTQSRQGKDDLVISAAKDADTLSRDSGKVVEFGVAQNQIRFSGTPPPNASAVCTTCPLSEAASQRR